MVDDLAIFATRVKFIPRVCGANMFRVPCTLAIAFGRRICFILRPVYANKN
jgi:hypothetical protein